MLARSTEWALHSGGDDCGDHLSGCGDECGACNGFGDCGDFGDCDDCGDCGDGGDCVVIVGMVVGLNN